MIHIHPPAMVNGDSLSAILGVLGRVHGRGQLRGLNFRTKLGLKMPKDIGSKKSRSQKGLDIIKTAKSLEGKDKGVLSNRKARRLLAKKKKG